MPSSALADAPRDAVQFAWVRTEGAETCPDMASLRRDVTQRLGHDPFTLDAPRSIEGVISREETRWHAHLLMRDEHGVIVAARDLDSEVPSCASLEPAIGLAITLAIDPDAPLVAVTASSAPPASEPAPASASPEPTAAPRAHTHHTRSVESTLPAWLRRHGTSVGLRAGVLTGLVPTTVFAGALAFDAPIWGPIRFSAGGLVAAASSVALENGAFAHFTPAQGWLALCFAPTPHPRLTLALCAGAAGGTVIARLSGEPPMTAARLLPGNAAWLGPMLDLRVSVTVVGPLAIELGAQGFAPMPVPRFDVASAGGFSGPQLMFRAGIFDAFAYGGLSVRF